MSGKTGISDTCILPGRMIIGQYRVIIAIKKFWVERRRIDVIWKGGVAAGVGGGGGGGGGAGGGGGSRNWYARRNHRSPCTLRGTTANVIVIAAV